MLYLGLPLEYREAQEIVGVKKVEEYLKERNSKLMLEWINKNVFILGVPLPQFGIREERYINFDNALRHLADAKILWKHEVNRLSFQLGDICIARMEGEEISVIDGEPYLIDA